MTGRTLLRGLLAAAVLATVVTPVAIAGADGAGASRASRKVTVKQFKALKKKTTALERQIAMLQAELKALPRGVAGGATGPLAGGDLTGTYPDPEIRAGTIVSDDILDGTIAAADIFDGTIATSDVLDETLTGEDIRDATLGTSDIGVQAVGMDDLNFNSAGSDKLLGTGAVRGDAVTVGPGLSEQATATCPLGTQLLSGGIEWSGVTLNLVALESGPLVTDPPPAEVTTWQVRGRNDNFFPRTLHATAICLKRE